MKQSSLRSGRRAGPRVLAAALRASCLGAAVAAAASCNTIDTQRVPGPNMSLGDDIYGVFCDRIGASSIPEDLTGASYNGVCHPDATGKYADVVDVSNLPPSKTAEQQRARKLSVAKLERMAQRRKDLIHALNAALPDVEIPDPQNPTQKVRLHDALMSLAQALTPLYESNPFDKNADPLVPTQTRAMARIFDAFGAPGKCAQDGKSCTWNADCAGSVCVSEPRDTLSGIWARRGYRPFQVGLGAVRPGLGYPELRTLTKSTLSVLGPGGSASAELQQALTVAHQEMLTAAVVDAAKPDFSVDPALGQPSRPREDMEFVQALMLTEGPAFQATAAGTPMYVARRDRRGFVVPAGNTPGLPGSVKAPFVDLGNDGYADVDSFGRFIDAAGTPLDLEPPFGIPGTTTGSIDQFGRSTSASAKYSYLDTSQTLVGGLTRHLLPLLDPTVITTGDPKAYEQEHEAVMYALAGSYVLFGDREDATYDYQKEGAKGGVVKYRRFKAEDSPIPDLIHAAGQILADPDSDALLGSLVDLMQNHEQTVARLMGAALQIREISKAHDTLAAQGTEKKAELAYSVTLWDEMADLVSDMAKHPGLLERLVKALADDTAVSPPRDPVTGQIISNVDHMGDALSRFMSYRDEMTYNPNGRTWDNKPGGINGPAINLTIGGGSIQDPQTPVDRSQPQTGKNASCMQRSLRLIHDSNGGPACNRAGAKVATKLGSISLPDWPMLGGGYNECELFQFDNLTLFYLDSLLPSAHPKRSFLEIKASDLNTILGVLKTFNVSIDDVLQASSDIEGLTQHPSPQALNRLVWFGASTQNYPAMPDHDFINAGSQVDQFVSGTIEPVSVATCPPDASSAPTCSDNAHTLRIQDGNTIFLWERFGFTQYLQPVVKAFADSSSDQEGEMLLVRLFELLHKHWPGPDHGSECVNDPASADHCPESGLNRYEPLLAEAFLTDIIPALHEFSKVAVDLSKVTVRRGPKAGQTWTGAQVLEKLTTVLFSKDYAASVGMKDRKGNAQTTWTDGSHKQQVTVYSLFADALHKMDTRWVDFCDCAKKSGADQATCQQNLNACLADADARKAQWKRARSLLVDEFLAVEGTGAGASFRNATIAPTLLATMQLAREQVNAHCKDREQTGGAPCTWASRELGQKLNDVMSRPLFAAIVDVQEKIRADEGARRQLEAFLQYALGSDPTALQGMLSSIVDLLQVLVDDRTLTPILQAGAPGMSPDRDPAGAGAASAGIQVLKAIVDDKYDPYHVMDHVLPLLVSPMDDGRGLAPIEIFMDVIADVNRVDAADTGPMASDDYQGVMSTMTGFMTDQTRGLEQLYTIIQRRPKQ